MHVCVCMLLARESLLVYVCASAHIVSACTWHVRSEYYATHLTPEPVKVCPNGRAQLKLEFQLWSVRCSLIHMLTILT